MPSKAVSVCRMAAPAIGADQTGRTGWQVGRTSLRFRNPDNALNVHAEYGYLVHEVTARQVGDWWRARR